MKQNIHMYIYVQLDSVKSTNILTFSLKMKQKPYIFEVFWYVLQMKQPRGRSCTSFFSI